MSLANAVPSSRTPTPEAPGRRLTARAFLVLLALASLAGVLLVPLTRPTVRAQARYALPFAPEALYAGNRGVAGVRRERKEAAFRRAAEPYAGDPAVQVAYAVTSAPMGEQMKALRPLLARFPDDPTVHAAFLLQAVRGEKIGVPTPEYLRAAEHGARLEPDNAFFPAMKAIALQLSGDISGMQTALHEAGRRAMWEDHTDAVTEGAWRFQAASGRALFYDRYVTYGAMSMLPFHRVRTVALDARDAAAEAERAGRVEEGIRTRLALIRLGSRMRAQAHNGLGAVVGASIERIAAEGPASARPKPPEGVDANAFRDAQEQRFLIWLAQHGHGHDVAWVRREFAAADAASDIVRKGTDRVDLWTLLLRWMAFWSVDIGLLGGVIWTLALGGASAVASRAGTIRSGEPLARGTRRGIVLGVAMSVVFVMIGADDPRAAVSLMLMISVVALLLGRKRAGIRAFGGTLLFLVVPVALLGSVGQLAAQTRGAEAITGVNATVLAAVGHPVLGLVVPLVVAVGLGVAALVRRVPVSAGVVRGMARAAVPAAALLGILYAGSAVVTARANADLCYLLERQVEHEGRFYADVLGRTWPE